MCLDYNNIPWVLAKWLGEVKINGCLELYPVNLEFRHYPPLIQDLLLL